MVKAASLKHKVTVQVNNSTTGDRGQLVPNWVDETTLVPAQIEELGGKKLELARQLVATASHQITIRYLSSLDTNRRFKDENGRIYNIGSIQDPNLLHFTQICTVTSQEGGS